MSPYDASSASFGDRQLWSEFRLPARILVPPNLKILRLVLQGLRATAASAVTRRTMSLAC